MAKKKKNIKGGKLNGPSHEEGGIPIEVEGGEFIVNISKNGAAKKHKDGLVALNDNPDNYEIVEKNSKLPKGNDYDFPAIDARKRKGGK